jgi:aminocarboxymuconate-semialdehyde decarboxylase
MFLETLAVTATGPLLPASLTASSASALQDAAASPRRTVSLGGRRVRVIDIHAHSEVPEVEAVVKGTPLEKNGVPDKLNLLGPQRLQLMDKSGVDVQALSINSRGYWWYAAERELADRIVRAQNEGLARWCQSHPDRFVALASVALQHPDLAATELEDGVKRLGMRGAAIGGHVRGDDLSLPKFDPFWAKASELDVPVFMHPSGATNLVKEGALGGRGDLANIIGMPLETTYFLARLIFDGTLDRFPTLKVCAPHGGGYMASYLGRAEVACDVRANAKCANKRRPSEYLKQQIFVDTIVLSDAGLRHLVAEVGADRIVYGTDVPFNWPVTIDLVLNASFLTEAQKGAILGGTLAKLLKISVA